MAGEGKRHAENIIEKTIAKKQKVIQKKQNSTNKSANLTTKFEAAPALKENDRDFFDRSYFVEKIGDLAKYTEPVIQIKRYISQNTPVVEASGSEETESDEDKFGDFANYMESNVQTKEFISQNSFIKEASESEESRSDENSSEESESYDEDKPGDLTKYTEPIVQTKRYVSQNTPVVETSGLEESLSDDEDVTTPENIKMEISEKSDKSMDGSGKLEDGCKVDSKTPQKKNNAHTKHTESFVQNKDVKQWFFLPVMEVSESDHKDDKDLVVKDATSVDQETMESNTIFCQNLSFKIEVDTLRDFFKEAGEVIKISLPRHPNGQIKKFAFVYFATAKAAKNAFKLNGRELLGRKVKIYWNEKKSTNSHQNRGQTEVQNGSLCHNSYQQLVPMNKASSFSLTAFIKGFNMEMDVNQIKANLFNFFDSCGEITDIILHEGGALLNFKDSGSLTNALLLNGLSFCGNPLTVIRFKPHDNNHNGGSFFGGRNGGNQGFGSRSYGGRGFRGISRGGGRGFRGIGRGGGRG